MKTLTCSVCAKSFSDEGANSSAPRCSACRAVTKSPKLSATSRAIQDAMKAMDEKEAQRSKKGVSRSSPKSSGSAAYQLGGTKSAITQEATTPAGKSWRDLQLKPKQWYMAGGGVVGLLVLFYIYSAVTPTAWESDQHDTIIQAKAEGDRLLAEGKKSAAFDAYGKIVLMTATRDLHSGEIKRAVASARQARVDLFPEIQASQGKAKLARYVH
jgi:hypothetical protein